MKPPVFSCLSSRVLNNGSLYGRFLFGPLPIDISLTIATILRRSLLHTQANLHIVSAEVEGATHEYAELPGIQESVLEILLNLGEIVLARKKQNLVSLVKNSPPMSVLQNKTQSNQRSLTASLNISGPCVVKAKDIHWPDGVWCVKPDVTVATLSNNHTLAMRLKIMPLVNRPFSNSFGSLENVSALGTNSNSVEPIRAENLSAELNSKKVANKRGCIATPTSSKFGLFRSLWNDVPISNLEKESVDILSSAFCAPQQEQSVFLSSRSAVSPDAPFCYASEAKEGLLPLGSTDSKQPVDLYAGLPDTFVFPRASAAHGVLNKKVETSTSSPMRRAAWEPSKKVLRSTENKIAREDTQKRRPLSAKKIGPWCGAKGGTDATQNTEGTNSVNVLQNQEEQSTALRRLLPKWNNEGFSLKHSMDKDLRSQIPFGRPSRYAQQFYRNPKFKSKNSVVYLKGQNAPTLETLLEKKEIKYFDNKNFSLTQKLLPKGVNLFSSIKYKPNANFEAEFSKSFFGPQSVVQKTLSRGPNSKSIKQAEDLNSTRNVLSSLYGTKTRELSVFSSTYPVEKVNFLIERDDQLAGYRHRIIFEVWTNGSISPRQAIFDSIGWILKLLYNFRQPTR